MTHTDESSLHHAARLCLDRDVELFRTLDISKTEVSPKTEKRILRAIADGSGKRSAFHTVKRVAVICLATVSLLLASAMCIPPVRAAVVEMVLTWYEKYVEVDFAYTAHANLPTPEENCILPQVPADWEAKEISLNWSSAFYTFKGTQGEYVRFFQEMDGDGFSVNSEHCVVKEIRLNDMHKAKLFSYEDGTFCIIWENQYAFVMIGDHMSLETFLQLAESVNVQVKTEY